MDKAQKVLEVLREFGKLKLERRLLDAPIVVAPRPRHNWLPNLRLPPRRAVQLSSFLFACNLLDELWAEGRERSAVAGGDAGRIDELRSLREELSSFGSHEVVQAWLSTLLIAEGHASAWDVDERRGESADAPKTEGRVGLLPWRANKVLEDCSEQGTVGFGVDLVGKFARGDVWRKKDASEGVLDDVEPLVSRHEELLLRRAARERGERSGAGLLLDCRARRFVLRRRVEGEAS